MLIVPLPFAAPLMWAFLLAFMLQPLNNKLLVKWPKKPGLAAGLLTALTPWCQDPRLATVLGDIVEKPPYNGSVSRTTPFWKFVFAAIPGPAARDAKTRPERQMNLSGVGVPKQEEIGRVGRRHFVHRIGVVSEHDEGARVG